MNCICQGSDKRKDHDKVSPINDGFLDLGVFQTKRYRTTVYAFDWHEFVAVAVLHPKKSEASPEECDQAVIGLSTAKAKEKAKHLQESQEVAKSVIQRVWETFFSFKISAKMYIEGALGVSEDITNIEDFFEVVDLR